ncbi:MAG: Holliday junction resolvase RuvX [bacterium]
MKRILGIDYGSVRVGLAISDPLGISAQPLKYLTNDKQLITNLAAIIAEKKAELILLGLPKSLGGGDSPQTEKVRSFAEALGKAANIEVKLWDERMSTKAVEKVLIDADLSRKKRKQVIDSAAACYILQGYLNSER